MKAKSILVPAIVLGAALTGAILWNYTGADAANTERRSEMAKELAAKLNVEESKVTEVMDAIHTERQAERKVEVSTKLDQAVTDGAITAEQKQKILDKMTENQSANSEGQNRGQRKAEMEKWYADNGIDFDKIHEYIGFGPGNGEGNGMGGGRGMHRGE